MKQNQLTRVVAIAMATIAVLPSADAQTYFRDQMIEHGHATEALENVALHKDNASNTYYIAQKIIPSEHNAVVFSEVDEDYNVIRTHKYVAMISSAGEVPVENNTFFVYPQDINFNDDDVYIVGKYIDEGVDYGGFMFCADKNTGAFRWFRKYTDIDYLMSVECRAGMSGAVAVGWRGGIGHTNQNVHAFWWTGLTEVAGVIVRSNSMGNLLWKREIEDDKYAGQSISSIANRLNEVKQLNEDEFIAVGRVNDYALGTFPYNDGDGAVVIFDAQGNISYRQALGNITPVGNGQNLRHEILQSVTTCSDGDVVLAGAVVEFPHTTFQAVCPGPVPFKCGVWVTKMNTGTGTVAWSRVYDWFTTAYDPNSFPQPLDIKIENDGTDNFGVVYHSVKESIMKLDINGNVVYSREYIHPSAGHRFKDISTGFGNTDIKAVGYVFNGAAINVTAFDVLSGQCNSLDLNVTWTPHEYEIFFIEENAPDRVIGTVNFLEEPDAITLYELCEKEEDIAQGPEMFRQKTEDVVVSQDAASLAVMVEVAAGETYTGKLMNSMGQTIQRYDNIQLRYTIKTSDLAAGIYFLHLHNGKHATTKAIQIQ